MARRRFLALMAAGSGAALAGLPGGVGAATGPEPLVWTGRLLGAEASLVLQAEDRAQAQAALAAVLARVRALEQVFSLHIADSALSRLNRQGRLADPPKALRDVLHYSRWMHWATRGAFDPSMQPLFALYAGHFAGRGADPAGPPRRVIKKTLARVGFERIEISTKAIRFTRPGMAISLNGIAQGYITDQACAVLAAHGLGHSLANFGEYRALGPRADASPWRLGLADPKAPWTLAGQVPLQSGALATSAGAGTAFDGAGRFTHLIHPASGRCAPVLAGVSVMAPQAALADALSTALAVVPVQQIAPILRRFAQAGALLTWPDGRQRRMAFPKI